MGRIHQGQVIHATKKEDTNRKGRRRPCLDCHREHSFHEGDARIHCLELMQFLEQEKRIDLVPGADRLIRS